MNRFFIKTLYLIKKRFSFLSKTLLEDPAQQVAKLNSCWMIEETFRVMKSEFKARPIYLSREKNQNPCFTNLLIFRIIQQKLNHDYIAHEIMKTLREFNLTDLKDLVYINGQKQ